MDIQRAVVYMWLELWYGYKESDCVHVEIAVVFV